MNDFKSYMQLAIEQANLVAKMGEIPVGAVIEYNGKVIAQAGNQTRQQNDPTAHAEINVIRKACKVLGRERLINANLYVTLEPCAMCAAAISHARIARVYVGARDHKSGGVFVGARVFDHPQCHHVPEVYDGISERICMDLLRNFFQNKR